MFSLFGSSLSLLLSPSLCNCAINGIAASNAVNAFKPLRIEGIHLDAICWTEMVRHDMSCEWVRQWMREIYYIFILHETKAWWQMVYPKWDGRMYRWESTWRIARELVRSVEFKSNSKQFISNNSDGNKPKLVNLRRLTSTEMPFEPKIEIKSWQSIKFPKLREF